MNPILIVDDEKDNLEALQRLLRQEFEVTATTSPFEALKLVQKKPYTVIVSDQRMPEMTGVELLEKVKNVAPSMTRVLLTGYTDIDSVIGAINRGNIYRYIAKPWDPDELKITLRQADEACRMRRELEKKNKELSQSNEDLQKAFEALSVLDQAKARFLYLISHELNTPLTVLGSFISLLTDKKSSLTPDLQKAVGALEGAAHRFSEIISEGLAYVKLSTDGKVSREQVDLAKEAQSVKVSLDKTIAAKSLRFNYTGPQSVKMAADPIKIKMALQRLLQDSVARAPEKSEIKTGVETTENKIRYWIERKGEALSAEAFSPFVNLGEELHHHKNLGLGLAMCKLIVEIHHGQILVDPVGKTGITKVILEFPI